MELIYTLAAIVLFLVFLTSATLKLRDLRAVEHGFVDLGLPSPKLMSRAVPLAELVIALALVLITPWGATLAFAMLVGFTVYLAQLVRQGVTVPCNCFGASAGAAVGPKELVRNGLLLVCAALALFSPNII